MLKQRLIKSSREMELAVGFLERWGGHPILPDGENSNGSQKFRVAEPQDLANRALDVAQALMAEGYRRGLMEDES